MSLADRNSWTSPGQYPGTAPPPNRIALMITCVADVLAPEVAEATVRAVRAIGTRVTCDLSQTCCGQPAWNAGLVNEAAAVARPTLEALIAELNRGADAIVVPAGSCAGMVRHFWVELFERAGDDHAMAEAQRVAEHTFELSELLEPHLPSLVPLRLSSPQRVAFHQSCHLLRELKVRTQPGGLLTAIDGCDLIDWDGADHCCGFSDTFRVKLPEASVPMADDTLRGLQAHAPDIITGCDPSCLLHLRSRAEALGTPVEVRHLAELIADALPTEEPGS